MSISIDGTPFISNIKTNDNGLQSYEYADGSKHTREYDTNGRVTKLTYPNYIEEVNYNKVSNITSINSNGKEKKFGYDNLDRLTSYDQNATDFQNFVYDTNGNRLNQEQENNESKVFTYAQNSNILNGIEESNSTNTKNISYEYDKTGNIIKDDKHTYAYDSRNRLTAIDNNVTYEYNYDNKRVSKTVNGVKTYFVYNRHMLVGEYQLNFSNDSRQEFVYLNSTPIATMRANEMGRVYADHLDTSRRVATNDEDAQIVWKWESKPFGETEASGEITFNLRFPGQYFDSETKTHYNINRDYNPVTGWYIQSDPIGFDGGVNGFAYVGGMPIVLSDSTGLCIDPGGIGVRYCIDAFISQKRIGLQTFYGDNRGSSAYISSGSDYRARVLIANYGEGYDFYPAIGVTHDIWGNSKMGTLNHWSAATDNYDFFSFSVRTSNALAQSYSFVPAWAVPSVKLDINILGSQVWGTRTRFPSLEIWMYTDSYAWQLYYHDAGHWYDSPAWLGLDVVSL